MSCILCFDDRIPQFEKAGYDGTTQTMIAENITYLDFFEYYFSLNTAGIEDEVEFLSVSLANTVLGCGIMFGRIIGSADFKINRVQSTIFITIYNIA